MRSVFLFGLACMFLPCLRAEEPPGSNKTPTAFEQASAEALREHKNLLLVFTAQWEPACAELEDDCLGRRKISNLLAAQTVIARVDVLTAPELTARYHVRDVPLMVLVKPDGTEVDRWLGAISADRFAGEYSQTIAGHPTIEHMRQDVTPSKPETRRDLAYALFNRGSYADALTELKRLYEQLEYGTTKDQLRANQKERNRTIALLGEIQKAHPPAGEFLRTKRNICATQAAPPSDKAKYAKRIPFIDAALGQPMETLAYFRSLPAGCAARTELRSNAFSLLVTNKEYAKAAALYKPEELAEQIEKMGSLPWSIIHGAIRARFPLKGGEIIKLFQTFLTANNTRYFQAFAGVQSKEGARLLAQMTIKYDRSEQAIPLLAQAARRALGENAESFLRSLEIPGLPPQRNASQNMDIPEPSDTPTAADEDADPVVKLSPFVVATRTIGVVPMEVTLPSILSHKAIPNHLPVRTPPAFASENLAPYRSGGWLVAINGKSIKGQDWKWLSEFWLEGGETGTPVTLVLKGTGADDCVYRAVTVKRVRPVTAAEK